jgi:ABC-type transporter Mla subunit MlaD
MSRTLFSRIGNWFKGGDSVTTSEGDLPLSGEVTDRPAGGEGEDSSTAIAPRSTFFRPWARQEQRYARIERGVVALSNLMDGIRGNLESQGRRQEELLKYLSHLPEALAAIPESNRMQGETLKAIAAQITHQNGQQQKLGEILERLANAAGEQRSTLDELQDRVDNLREHDAAISENLNSVGAAMQHVSRSSAESTKVLEQLRENMSSRDNDMRTAIDRQSNKFTTLLSVAIFLSTAALIGVCVVGYLVYEALQKTSQ